MKKFIKSKLFPVAVLAVVEISLLVLLYCNGFRITYAPDLENSWDAVSAIAAWGGVFASFVAILVAIQIPKKIADRQDKIALFEKRFEIYTSLSSCTSSVRIIESGAKIEDKDEDEGIHILKCLFIAFSENPRAYKDFNRDEAKSHLMNCATKLRRASFFFSVGIAAYIINVSLALLMLVNTDPNVDGFEEYNKMKQEYFEAVRQLEKNKIIEGIRAEMKMI